MKDPSMASPKAGGNKGGGGGTLPSTAVAGSTTTTTPTTTTNTTPPRASLYKELLTDSMKVEGGPLDYLFSSSSTTTVGGDGGGRDKITSSGSHTTTSHSHTPASSSPAKALSQALLRVDGIYEPLYQGLNVIKLTSSGGAARTQRVLTLCQDHLAIWITHHDMPASSPSSSSSLTGWMQGATSQLPLPRWTPRKGLTWTNDVTANRERYVRYLDIADIDAIVVGAVVSTVMEGRTEMAKNNNNNNEDQSSSMVTIFHHGMEESLNLLVADSAHRRGLVETLQNLRAAYHAVIPWISHKALLLRYLWYHVDVDQNGLVSRKEFQNICDIINLDGIDVHKHFDRFVATRAAATASAADSSSSAVATYNNGGGKNTQLTYQESMQLLRQIQEALTKGSDWERDGALWDNLILPGVEQGSLSPGGHSITPQALWKHFLHETQRETDTTIQDAQQLLQCMTRFDLDSTAAVPVVPAAAPEAVAVASPAFTDSPDSPIFVTKGQWEEYLLSKFNSAYDPAMLQSPRDDDDYWNHPISHYWINTSHNTYLMGDQLKSKSSVEAYLMSLERGCKCLELDCWDGKESSKQQQQHSAVVFHGHTLTSKILFVDILKVVQAYLQAHPTTLPIILSLENHCSHPFQLEMAAQLRRVFGDAMYVPPLSRNKGNVSTPLPSPNELRGKVIIKGKRPPEPDEDTTTTTATTTTEQPITIDDDASPAVVDEEDPYDDALQKKKKKKSSSKIVPELAALTLFHGTKFKTFDTSIALDPSHMHSIGETKITKILGKGLAQSWRHYNQEHMTRTYPAGVRVDSSNYNPTVAWAVGCQLVALNFQTPDTPLLLNDGRFRQAGNHGYVLKPPTVMGTAKKRPQQQHPKTVHVKIISGHCLPKPKGRKVGEAIDPYVKVELHDVRALSSDGKEEYCSDVLTTSVVKNNGFCPVWTSKTDQKVFHVQQPDVAILLFQVLDEDLGLDDKIASAAIPVNALREGYRSIQLYSGLKSHRCSGPFEYARLLVRIDFTETKPPAAGK